ncbi:hypothetical protein [Gellertiella hungarica]|uniref:Uncharacterized protein n=1 Tax=Gellertiella hungarica TaxID=1572859 RepID=A0A7W6NM24_9HYPH|nr:hypothetical protein [Gellertiella hungarica]MBB4065947.1 hypothetical protein [Gellertiella hungarica]
MGVHPQALDDFFQTFATAVTAIDAPTQVAGYFSTPLLCDRDLIMPFALGKPERRALLRLLRRERRDCAHRAISFEIVDFVPCGERRYCVTVRWALNVEALARVAGRATVQACYLLLLTDSGIEILAATDVEDEAAEAA